MNFKKSEEYLLKIFNENNFISNIKTNEHASQVVIETCSNGTKISVSFPGYKSYVSGTKTIYDYRVDITKNGIKTALSHTNIITDIYNKIKSGKISATELKVILIEIFKEGNIDLNSIVLRLPYTSIAPNDDLLIRVKNAHGDKNYNIAGNSFDLTLEELFCSIKWIVLQEDINYPIPFEGRRMPLARYLETIFITQNNSHTLEDVIKRALIHSRPTQWADMDYLFRNQIL